MIYLDFPSRKLEVVLSAAVTTNQLQVTAHFFDQVPQATTSLRRGGDQVSLSDSTNDVTIVSAPALQGIIRNIHTISIYNADTVAATVSVKIDDSGTEKILVKQELDSGASLTYEDGTGWMVIGGDTTVQKAISIMNCRLTLTSGTAVTTADVTGAETIYLTPFDGNRIWLYDGTVWVAYALSEISGDVPDAAQMNDVFVYDNSGTLTLDIVAWTNDTTRATALALQDGVLVKTGALGRRYVGSFYSDITGNGQTEDSAANRYVWNYYNRKFRPMKAALETTNTWTYTSTTIRQANANTANQLNFCIGVSQDRVFATAKGIAGHDGGGANEGMQVFIGLDVTNAMATGCLPGVTELFDAATFLEAQAEYAGFSGIGKHFLSWLERTSTGTITYTWYGDVGSPAVVQTGIQGGLWG